MHGQGSGQLRDIGYDVMSFRERFDSDAITELHIAGWKMTRTITDGNNIKIRVLLYCSFGIRNRIFASSRI